MMQPVQFKCGHCGQLMAVNSEHLGQQVRCPHCQQIVLAPVPEPAPPTMTASTAEAPPPGPIESILPTPADDAEDIFSPVEVTDDLFGRGEAPRIEMPPDPLTLKQTGDEAAPPAEMPAAAFSTMPWIPPESAAPPTSPSLLAPSESLAMPPLDAVHPGPTGAIAESLAPHPSELPAPVEAPASLDGDSSTASRRARRRTEQKAPWFLLLVFCPLLLYAIVISIFSFFLYRHDQHLQEQLRNPFENMPDVGDDPGVQKGKKVSRTDRYKPELATRPLPDHLCTTLGNPLRLGDLEVTPKRVERKRVSVIVGTSRPEPCSNDSLVLYLDMKNISSDYVFAPLDHYFDRYWRPGVDLIPPLTQLEIGSLYRCYGGPARWYPRGDRSNPRQRIKGRPDEAERLHPGEEKELFVCTDGDDAKAAALLFGGPSDEKYHGPFLWRVRVRRGLVPFQDKHYSATAVLGVRFTDKDIHQADSEVQ